MTDETETEAPRKRNLQRASKYREDIVTLLMEHPKGLTKAQIRDKLIEPDGVDRNSFWDNVIYRLQSGGDIVKGDHQHGYPATYVAAAHAGDLQRNGGDGIADLSDVRPFKEPEDPPVIQNAMAPDYPIHPQPKHREWIADEPDGTTTVEVVDGLDVGMRINISVDIPIEALASVEPELLAELFESTARFKAAVRRINSTLDTVKAE